MKVVIWLLLISVAASDKLPDFSEVLGGYLPPSNAFVSQPHKDPFQSFSFDLPAPASVPSASHSSPSDSKVSDESVEVQYAPPKETSKEHHAEPHTGTCILANPYVQQPSQSQEKHEPPQQTYLAPDKSEEQSVSQLYELPQQSYIPPEESKEVKQVYKPPQQTYGTPDESEESKVEQTYEPPQQTYLAPHESEEAKEEEIHEPPNTNYLVPDKSEEDEVPVVPQTLYETPVKSPSSHFQSPQNSYKPPKSEPPKKTFQVPELIQTYGPPNHNRPKPENDDDSREGSASFSSHFTPSDDKDEDKQSSSLFFKLPEPTYSQPKPQPKDSDEITPRPQPTYEIPRPGYQVPQPAYQPPKTSYFIPNADDDQSKEVPEQTYEQPKPSYSPPVQSQKAPSTTNFFSIPQQTYKVPEPSHLSSLESSNESREHSQQDDEDDRPTQQYKPPQQSYSIPQEDSHERPSHESPKQAYAPPVQSYKPPRAQQFSSRPTASKSKTDFFSTPKLEHRPPAKPSSSQVQQTYSPPKSPPKQKESTIKFRPILKKPKPTPIEDSDEEFSAPKLSSIHKSSAEQKDKKPSGTHSFFKTPSSQKQSTGSKSPAPISTGYSAPNKNSEEDNKDEKKPKPSGSILFPTHQVTEKPKEDSKEEDKKPSRQSHKAPEQSYKPPSNNEDSQEKYQPPKQSPSNVEPTFHSKESIQAPETTTMKMLMPYDFKWGVKDEDSGNDFGQTAVSDGMVEKGSYHVLLPDGRKQIVTYLADWETGFHVDVKYEGEADPFPEASQQKEASGSYS